MAEDRVVAATVAGQILSGAGQTSLDRFDAVADHVLEWIRRG